MKNQTTIDLWGLAAQDCWLSSSRFELRVSRFHAFLWRAHLWTSKSWRNPEKTFLNNDFKLSHQRGNPTLQNMCVMPSPSVCFSFVFLVARRPYAQPARKKAKKCEVVCGHRTWDKLCHWARLKSCRACMRKWKCSKLYNFMNSCLWGLSVGAGWHKCTSYSKISCGFFFVGGLCCHETLYARMNHRPSIMRLA